MKRLKTIDEIKAGLGEFFKKEAKRRNTMETENKFICIEGQNGWTIINLTYVEQILPGMGLHPGKESQICWKSGGFSFVEWTPLRIYEEIKKVMT